MKNVMAVLAIVVLSGCLPAVPPPVVAPVVAPPIFVPHLGGPGLRVFDADEVDTIEAIPILMSIHHQVQNCSGGTRPYKGVRVFIVSKIMIKKPGESDWTEDIAGLNYDNVIYITRAASINKGLRIWIITHEFVHYVNWGEGHPDVDEKMKKCGVHYEKKDAPSE